MFIKGYCPILALFNAYQRFRERALNYSENVVWDTNKHFKFKRQKAASLINVLTKFLDMVTKRQNKKDHGVSAILLIFFNFRQQKSDESFLTQSV